MNIRMFRGISKDTKEWVYGYYYKLYTGDFILTPDDNGIYYSQTVVIPETVGQAVNRQDIHKQEIHEGDIVTDGKNKYVVEFWQSSYQLRDYYNGELKDYFMCIGDYLGKLEVIGSIHDHLLKGDDKG